MWHVYNLKQPVIISYNHDTGVVNLTSLLLVCVSLVCPHITMHAPLTGMYINEILLDA